MSNQTVTVALGLSGGLHKVEATGMTVAEALDTAVKRANLQDDLRLATYDAASGQWAFTEAGKKVVLGVNGNGTHSPQPNDPADQYRTISVETKRKNG